MKYTLTKLSLKWKIISPSVTKGFLLSDRLQLSFKVFFIRDPLIRLLVLMVAGLLMIIWRHHTLSIVVIPLRFTLPLVRILLILRLLFTLPSFLGWQLLLFHGRDHNGWCVNIIQIDVSIIFFLYLLKTFIKQLSFLITYLPNNSSVQFLS